MKTYRIKVVRDSEGYKYREALRDEDELKLIDHSNSPFVKEPKIKNAINKAYDVIIEGIKRVSYGKLPVESITLCDVRIDATEYEEGGYDLSEGFVALTFVISLNDFRKWDDLDAELMISAITKIAIRRFGESNYYPTEGSNENTELVVNIAVPLE